jgi:hypothetical protein
MNSGQSLRGTNNSTATKNGVVGQNGATLMLDGGIPTA